MTGFGDGVGLDSSCWMVAGLDDNDEGGLYGSRYSVSENKTCACMDFIYAKNKVSENEQFQI